MRHEKQKKRTVFEPLQTEKNVSKMASEPWLSSLLMNNQGFSQWFYSCSLWWSGDRWENYKKEIPFPFKSSKSMQGPQTIHFFYSHDMLQDADSNA